MTLADRVQKLRAAAQSAYRQYLDHAREHRCSDWTWVQHDGQRERFDRDRDCFVRLTLLHAWALLDEASELPSRDPRMYRDETENVTSEAAVAAGGATT